LLPKKCGMFGALNRVIWPCFQLFLLQWCLGPKKSWKFGRDHFNTYRWEMTRNVSQIGWLCFGCQNRVIRTRFSSLPALVVLGHGKVVKIQPKQIVAVLMGNEKNCTTKSMGMFRALNRFLRARFSTLHASVVLGLDNVVKIRPKDFSAILIGNDKKCVPNNVCMFWVQNRVIRACF